MAVRGDVLDELLVFLRRPQAPPDLLLVAAGVVPHLAPKAGSATTGLAAVHSTQDGIGNEMEGQNHLSSSGAWL